MDDVWVRIADSVGSRAATTARRWLEKDDLVHEGMLGVLSETDVVKRAWALRQGVRDAQRKVVLADRVEVLVETVDDELDDGWLACLDEPDPLEARIREAYKDPDLAEAAVRASRGTGHASVEWEAIETQEATEAALVEEYWEPPVYMTAEERLDWELVEGLVPKLGRRALAALREYKHERYVLIALNHLGSDLVVRAYEHGLTGSECATLVNLVARKVADASLPSLAGRRYGALRIGAGDHMALCDEGPGVTSGYGIEDEEVWRRLFPVGADGTETAGLPSGSVSDIEALIETVGDRTSPEDVTWDSDGYRGWEHWDVAVARQAELRACLVGLLPWDEAATARSRAFWRLPLAKQLIAQNRAALHAEGLRREPALGYRVVPLGAVVVDKLYKTGVETNGQLVPFRAGRLDMVVTGGPERADRLREQLVNLGVDNPSVIGV